MDAAAAAEPVEQMSALSWMFQSLGPIYGLLLPLSGLLLFIGACLVVSMSKRPSVIAAYLVFVPLPLLIGVFGSLHGLIAGMRVVAMSDAVPRFPEVAVAMSMSLFSAWVGLFVMFPSYLVIALGLFARTALRRDEQST